MKDRIILFFTRLPGCKKFLKSGAADQVLKRVSAILQDLHDQKV
ncbi:hypothetical protein BSI_04830 [Bacillus inaquosorum KCTC 13429]|uniref:Uncharacterized protein n=1 Tax=Bacillus inaquosorum KCTC 13429 TaxID=1236548 RepID=A0A9W5PES1_9BACI|nr:hypothetical protein BSI_04830 [Bacillus inaquosorum KCTC 13429]